MQLTTITVALLLAACCSAQRYDDYDDSPPVRAPARHHAPSFSDSSSGPKPTPIAILKQINRHNEDGSYTYGYEGGDGSFKIETKLPNGEVKGKYGYKDSVTGKVRVVEYGANRYGFQPVGEGITVAPPTIVDETTNKDGTLNAEYRDQGQYYAPEPAPRAPIARPRPAPQQYEPDYSAPRFAPQPQRSAAPVPPRVQIPGAAPVEIDYTRPAPRPAPVHTFSPAPRPAPHRISFADPAPVEEDITYAEPAPRPAPRPSTITRPAVFRPAPQASQFAPQASQFAPQAQAPSYAPRPSGGHSSAPSGGGILDQLARDYALPQDSAAPLHDISFGYY